MRGRAVVISVGAAFVLLSSCTRDFDAFQVSEHGVAPDAGASGTGGADAASSSGGANGGGAGGATPDAAASGGVSGNGGTAGSSDAGRDATVGTDGGPDAARGGAGPGADSGRDGSAVDAGGGCLASEKRCGAECVALDSPATGCAGASCLACSLTNIVSAKCVASACAPDVCQGGYGDCNGIASDGCEHDVTGDPLQCGTCARSCAGDNVAGRACNAGACTSSCDPGHANCARPTTGPDDGCEIDATTDAKNCGACGNDCTMQNGKACSGGLCGCTADVQCRSGTASGTITCDTGTGLCACNAATCRHGESCRNGACACNGGAACTGSDTCCRSPAGCKNLMTDAGSCGACGHACTAGFVCVAGGCACNDDADCNAGTAGTCTTGVCHCGASTCGAGERCLPDGQCG